VIDIETPHGPARAHLLEAEAPRAALVLGHGAGGGVQAPDLQAAAKAALAEGVSVALVEQPYRVAGRRSPAPAGQLDAAWIAVARHLAGGPLAGLPLVTGGRSAGARVACRTAAATGAIAVVCLAFPLQPRPRKSGTQSPSRLPELEAVKVPLLIVQGENDQFGMPPAGRKRKVVQIRGDHSLRSDLPAVSEAVAAFLRARTGPARRAAPRKRPAPRASGSARR
jgi:predicted alpha/beta-hydrolase family hydrolase